MTRLAISAVLCLVAGCLQKGNPYYCGGRNPDNNCKEDMVRSCNMSTDCPMDVPVCDTVAKICVQCTDTQHAACIGDQPICRDSHCDGCNFHDECPISSVCLPSGACAGIDNVAYVNAGAVTDNLMCTMGLPCKSIMTAITTHQPYIKLSGGFDEAVNINIPGQSVVILADHGASLTRSGGGNVLVIDGNSKVEIYDLAINGASDMGAGVSLSPGSNQTVTLGHVSMSGNNGKLGAIAVFGGTLIVKRSTISDNRGGGISISMGQFDIENNFIVKNGDDQSMIGGISLDKIGPDGTRTLAFNTISGNTSSATTNITPGVACSSTVAKGPPFSSNIVYDNGAGTQVDAGPCSWTYSDFSGPAVSGVENKTLPPSFVNAASNFHLMSTSLLIDKGDPSAALDIDIDGDKRPQGTQRDIGADEYKAP